jgi:NAD(P)-dependent dehydrogenase (short-subunit alcohol dehydrogenase family)
LAELAQDRRRAVLRGDARGEAAHGVRQHQAGLEPLTAYAGKTALVTGAGRNIGRAIALTLAGHGVAVAVNARTNEAEAQETAGAVRARGVPGTVVLGDVGDAEACEGIVARAEAELGAVDYLVSNAARRPRRPFAELTVGEWDALIRSNLSALFYLSRLVVPGMVERGFGRIVAIGGPDGRIGMPNRAYNVAAKHGIEGLVKAMAIELAPAGVTANVVVPGAIDTTRDPVDYPGFRPEAPPRGVPAGRFGTVQELADAVAFLCSDAAGYVTGQALAVDGGLLSGLGRD